MEQNEIVQEMKKIGIVLQNLKRHADAVVYEKPEMYKMINAARKDVDKLMMQGQKYLRFGKLDEASACVSEMQKILMPVATAVDESRKTVPQDIVESMATAQKKCDEITKKIDEIPQNTSTGDIPALCDAAHTQIAQARQCIDWEKFDQAREHIANANGMYETALREITAMGA